MRYRWVANATELELGRFLSGHLWWTTTHTTLIGLSRRRRTSAARVLKRNSHELNEQVSRDARHNRHTRQAEILTPGTVATTPTVIVRCRCQENRNFNARQPKTKNCSLLRHGEKELDAFKDAVEKREQLRVCFRGGG